MAVSLALLTVCGQRAASPSTDMRVICVGAEDLLKQSGLSGSLKGNTGHMGGGGGRGGGVLTPGYGFTSLPRVTCSHAAALFLATVPGTHCGWSL